MRIEEFFDAVGLNDEAKKVIADNPIPDTELAEYLQALDADTDAATKALKSKKDFERYSLSLYARLAHVVALDLEKEGVPRDIVLDTFRDLSVWNKVCIMETGICGLHEVDWLSNHLMRKLFKIGRLQYVKDILQEDIVLADRTVASGSDIYYVHIPAGEPLSAEACENSYRMALSFFRKEELVLLCDSWLLSPVLDEIIDRDSNISKFKSKFAIFSVDANNRSAERYVFGKISDPAAYPENTSLQKKIKHYLLSGKPIGNGVGISFYRKNPVK